MNSKEQVNQPLYRGYRKNSQLVIFIHGILESPKQFRKLDQLARQEGYSTYRFYLPGHGGSSGYFAKTSYKVWIECTTRYITKLNKQYKEIILVGHSMGALLAICEAAHRQKGIKALFLIDPPVSIHLWPRVIKNAMIISFGKHQHMRPYTKAEYHAMGVAPLKLQDSIGWIMRYSELLSIICYTRKQILKLKLPMFLVFANKDEFVSEKGGRYFKGYRGKLGRLYLPDSGHFCYNHNDLLLLEKAYLEFIREQRKM